MAAVSNINSAKVKEGDKLVAEGEKHLKTSWLKWNSDYDSASHCFDKAALCYRSAKAFDKARETFERAADAHYKNHALFQSGKALEQAANICRDRKDLDEAAKYLERASAMYHESGHGDTAGQVLTKAGKLMESTDPQKSAYYYLATADLHDIEEKYRESASAVRSAVNMYAKARHLDKMLDALQRFKKINEQFGRHTHFHEAVAIEVVIHLHNDDTVAATDTLDAANRIPGFPDSDYAPVLLTLVESYKEKEQDSFNRSCDDSIFKNMDIEVAKLARDLKKKLDFDGFESPTTASSFTAAVNLPDEVEQDEEEESTPDIL